VCCTTVAAESFGEFCGDSHEKRCSSARHRSSPVAAACLRLRRRLSVNRHGAQGRDVRGAGAAWLPVEETPRSRSGFVSGSLNQGRLFRAVDLKVPRARDVVGKIAAELHRHDAVLGGHE